MFSIGSSGPDLSQGHTHDSMMSLSPQQQHSPGGLNQSISSPFLPGYLLGDHPQLHHHASSPRLWSTPVIQSPSSKSTGAFPGSSRRESARSRLGAPPVKSLFSSPPSTENLALQGRPGDDNLLLGRSVSCTAPPTVGMYTPSHIRGDPNTSLNQSQALPSSPAQTDPFFTQGDLKSDDVLDETWVTVFGFPSGATSFILQQFAQYGTIIKHVVASECNWMHIHYQSKIQAKKALSKDGKVYGGCMRIGVTPCIEKAVMEEKENQFVLSPTGIDDSFVSTVALNSSSLTPIRPLTAAYIASKGEYDVLQDKQTPKRDLSLVSKLKEYMFGY